MITYERHHILKSDGVALTYSLEEPDTIRIALLDEKEMINITPKQAHALRDLLSSWADGAYE